MSMIPPPAPGLRKAVIRSGENLQIQIHQSSKKTVRRTLRRQHRAIVPMLTVRNRQKEELFSVLHGEDFSAQAYRDSFARFKRSVQEREREYINLTAYFVFRYFMKAAYDHDVYGKAQLITANYLVLQEMDFLRWIQNGEKYGFKDRMELIHIFSREVEYSEENLEDLAEEFLFDDIFEKEQLCALLKG